MAQITVNGISVEYQLHGPQDGPPLVFIAGMGGAGSFWAPQLDAFIRSYRVLVYDQRGTGGTERVKVDSIEQLAEDLIALMRKLDILDAHLVGHSTGGAIAMVVAERARTGALSGAVCQCASGRCLSAPGLGLTQADPSAAGARSLRANHIAVLLSA